MRWLRMSERPKGLRGISGLVVAMIAFSGGVCSAAPKTGAKKPVPESSPPAKRPLGQRPPATEDLYEGPAASRPPKPPASRPAVPENKVEAPLSPGPKYADAWPSEMRKAEADLHLTPESENRAQAIAAFVEGQAAEVRGDPDKALEAWKRASGLDPGNADLAVKVAFELAKRNEPAEAIRVLKDSIAAAPNAPQSQVYLSQIYAKHLDKPDLAMQVAHKAMEVVPDYFPAWVAVYELHQQAGEKKKAVELLDKAMKNSTKKPEFWLQLGGYLRKVFLKEDGSVTPEELRPMEFAFRRAAELKPGDASVLAQVGDFFVLAGKNPEALEFYRRAVKLNQPARDEWTKNLREKYIRSLVANDRRAEAIPLLEQLARDPTQSLRHDLFELLGDLYEKSGQLDKALDHYKGSLVLDTSSPTNHFNLANMQMRAKRFEDAIATMERARMRFRDRPDVTLGLALALNAAKRHADALTLFSQVVAEAKGRNDGLLDAEFYFKWGATAEQAGQVDKAVECLQKSISLDPDAPEAYNYLGYMWVDKGQNIEEAGQLIRRAVEMNPDNGAYLDSLGWYYFKAGKFEDAKKQLLAALDKLPEPDAVVVDHLADVYEQLGQHAEAIKQWERALALKAESPDAIRKKIEEARKRLPGAK